MKQFRPAKKRITVSTGESVRIIRELQSLSQNQLAQRTGIPQATLSAIEMTVSAWASSAQRSSRAPLNAIPSYWSSPDGKIIFKRRHNPLLQPAR